jgi:hypothetical protein
MNKKFRIVLENELFPVQAFFNAIPDDSFLKVIESFSKNVGASFNDCYCEFLGDLDSEDIPIDGIQFSLYEQEVVISKINFLSYLTRVCDIFLHDNPNKKENIERLLNSIAISMS